MQEEAVRMVSSDVNFAKGQFPEYKIGANNMIIEPEKSSEIIPLKEIVARETAQLLEQHKRLSVRDLKEKFEKGLLGANKLSNEAKWREVASLDRQVLLKKLRDTLESLRGEWLVLIEMMLKKQSHWSDSPPFLITFFNQLSIVEALAVQLTQREGELLHEKAEVKKLANFLKQATEDARKVAEEERAIALAEIEKAKAAIKRVEQALEEHELSTTSTENQELEELRKEIQEARRIKMLHQPSRVMDMEHELRALRKLVLEKTQLCIQLKKELAMIKKLQDEGPHLYELEGSESLGSCLRIVCRSDSAPGISNYSIQWYRVNAEGSRKEIISGATKEIYAPEPFDVGRILHAEMNLNDQRVTLMTMSPIDPAAGLGSYVEALSKKSDSEFNVVVTQANGRDYASNSVHVFHVGKLRIKLRKGRSTKAKESYSASMQLCGVRGGGNAAAKAVFWQSKKGLVFTLAFESERERNAAIMLARKFASDCNVLLLGPDDQAPAGT
uniref:Stomatal closure-related actin-binding protein 1 n=1 Tax=Ananas comosus var. bracteatus TaxID=296719 RepID=A0A6V7PG58_ANACO|nr:unnamed protein product [Ananas comosus var. bracteatus]